MRGSSLARLRKTLRRHAREGWTRAVFARPREDAAGSDGGSDGGPDGRPDGGKAEGADAPRVHDGPGTDAPVAEEVLQALVTAAEAAAREGYVKITLVLDERRRVKIDARHGKAKVVELDEARARKVMGGKQRALRPDDSAEVLRVIGIMNADGTISTRAAKKYKQVNHFVELCRPVWERLVAARTPTEAEPLRVLDLGCGNGYLDFVLVEALRLAGVPVRLHGVDRRADVIAQCQARAQTLGWPGLSFACTTIDTVAVSQTPLGGPPELVVALHACDTATDDALGLAIEAGAQSILAAPCCQHELAAQLDGKGGEGGAPVPALLQHAVLRQEYAAQLTDALRVELLQACGYRVDAIEFVASQHTPKNLLLRAHRRGHGAVDRTRWRLEAVTQRCETLGVRPRLLDTLRGAG